MKLNPDELTACNGCGLVYANFLYAAEHESECSKVPRAITIHVR